MINLPMITEHDGIKVVRDDLFPGGTKARVLPKILEQMEAKSTVVYASPVYGYAQIALAHAAKETGRKAVVFVAKRKVPHNRTMQAIWAGAHIKQVDYGYLKVVQKAARDFSDENNATLIPFGIDMLEMRQALTALAQQLNLQPTEVWTVAGSGTLSRSLQAAWPDANFHAVQIGREPNAGTAKIYLAPESFEDSAKIKPPFPSCSNYDAKAWRFIKKHANPNALFWNVGA
jgi:threonine dehydratase